MTNTFDIVSFIENNPISKLYLPYQNKFINKIKHSFNEEEQSLFVAVFYSYPRYKPNDFVIYLDDIWEWLGFANKGNAKRTLQTFAVEHKDYNLESYNQNTKSYSN